MFEKIKWFLKYLMIFLKSVSGIGKQSQLQHELVEQLHRLAKSSKRGNFELGKLNFALVHISYLLILLLLLWINIGERCDDSEHRQNIATRRQTRGSRWQDEWLGDKRKDKLLKSLIIFFVFVLNGWWLIFVFNSSRRFNSMYKPKKWNERCGGRTSKWCSF